MQMMSDHHSWVFKLLNQFQHPDNGITPLHNACYFRRDEAIRILRENGYSDSVLDNKERTPHDYYQNQYGYNMLDEYNESLAQISDPLIASLRNIYGQRHASDTADSIKVAKSDVGTLFSREKYTDSEIATTSFPREKLTESRIDITPQWQEIQMDDARLQNSGFDECIFAYKVNEPLNPEVSLVSFLLLKTSDDNYIFMINPCLDEFENNTEVTKKIENDAHRTAMLIRKFKLN